MREDTYTVKNPKRTEFQTFLQICSIPLFIVVFAIISIINVPDSLSDCYYSQGGLLVNNSYYKTVNNSRYKSVFLTFIDNSNPIDPNIPCAKITDDFHHLINRDYNKIDSFIKKDSTEHFIQIWYQEHRNWSRTGPNKSREIFQIIIDGTVVLPFNKWKHQQTSFIMMIIGVLLLGLLIKLYDLKRHNSYFIKKYTKIYFKNKEGLSSLANELISQNFSEPTEFRLGEVRGSEYLTKYRKVRVFSFNHVGCFSNLVWFHREQRNRNKNVCSLEKCPNPYKYYPNCNIYSGNDYPKDTDTNCMYHIEDDWYIRLP